MLKTTELIAPFSDFHEFLGYSPENSLFFDIETTGLSPASSMVFLIGTVHRTPEGWQLTQYLCEQPEEEELLLRRFSEDAAAFSTLIHFNGASFDVPYLNTKLNACQLPPLTKCQYGQPDKTVNSLDLYQRFRSLKTLLHLERMNQTSLEQFVGWQRTDRLTGKHMVELFHKYTRSLEPGLKELILLHNHDDLVGMTKILCLSSYLIALSGQVSDVYIEPDETADVLCLHFSLPHALPTAFSHPEYYHLFMEGSKGQMRIPVYTGELLYFFPDYKNYYFLPLENQAVHKSVGQYMDASYRTPAKASNCYVRKTGTFLPQPEEIFTPAFRKAWNTGSLYFESSAALSASEQTLQHYVTSLLCTFIH